MTTCPSVEAGTDAHATDTATDTARAAHPGHRDREVEADVTAGEHRAWPAILALGLGIGALVSSEFLPASVLPAMAGALGVSEGRAGLAVAATALAGAVTAPSIAVVFPRTDRRTILIWLLLAATLSNLTVALAPSFAILLVGRLVLGVAIAGYWSFAFGAGTHAMPGRDHVVSTTLALGVTLATIVGVPLASVAADAVGWRAVFWAATVLSVLSAAAVARTLPAVPVRPGAGLSALRRALSHRRLMCGIALIVLIAFGNFAAYPYIRPAIAVVAPDQTGWLLLAWGAGGVVGNLAAGRFASRLRIVAAAAPLLLAASLVLAASAETVPVLVVAVVAWGLAFNAVPVTTQLWVTRAEPDRAESALSLQVTAFQVAITLGSAVGGALLDSRGLASAFLVGAVAAGLAGIGFAALPSRRGSSSR
ncbi:MAG: MFS transporter [Nocardioides sp.]|uniref:MFS transporter n=1 Tax=Nocardioides sp. TaxID=35761 RepID=UPI0039E4ADBD